MQRTNCHPLKSKFALAGVRAKTIAAYLQEKTKFPTSQQTLGMWLNLKLKMPKDIEILLEEYAKNISKVEKK